MRIRQIMRSPFWLICMYVLFILGFAFIYYTFYNDQFYHTTLKYEKAYQTLEDTVLRDIKTGLVNNFKAHHNDSTMLEVRADGQTAYLHIDRMHLENLQAEVGEITFTGYFHSTDLWHLQPGKGRPNNHNYTFTLRTNARSSFSPDSTGTKRDIWAYSYPDNPIDARYLLPKTDSLSSSTIHLTDHEVAEINALIDYNEGLIRDNTFKRMVYFSSVTIATVGYGDIVPIDDNLRILVGLEAILGIIFIGLFINSFADWLRTD